MGYFCTGGMENSVLALSLKYGTDLLVASSFHPVFPQNHPCSTTTGSVHRGVDQGSSTRLQSLVAGGNLPGVMLHQSPGWDVLGSFCRHRITQPPLPEPPHRAGRVRRLGEKEFLSRDRKARLELKDMG